MQVPNQSRCVNLDWLEVHCMEPSGDPHDANYFRRVGLTVSERDYGTRVYKEMFTVNDVHGNPFVEVRRAPYSTGYGGIHAIEECHLRLVNAACYLDNAAALMQNFIDTYGYTVNRISRVDICLDFERFDEGDDPAVFLSRYLRQVYSKINQGNITAHGADRWNGQVWNSVSWGSPTSAIGTKFYNKTMELYDAATGTYRKPHIRYAWLKCGLIDDFHKVMKHAYQDFVFVLAGLSDSGHMQQLRVSVQVEVSVELLSHDIYGSLDTAFELLLNILKRGGMKIFLQLLHDFE